MSGISLPNRIKWGTLAVAAPVVLGLYGRFVGARINLSPSMPIGIYIPAQNSDLVQFCPPQRYAAYRAPGDCEDGLEPLLKPIVTHRGDVVRLSEEGISVNGWLLPNTAPRPRDGHGIVIGHYPFGEYVVPDGSAWVASSHSSNSLDSRYFGPIPLTEVRCRMRPFLVIQKDAPAGLSQVQLEVLEMWKPSNGSQRFTFMLHH